MAVLANAQPFVIALGASEVGPLDLPTGARSLLVTYECASWPVTSDGSITFTLRIADDGVNYRNEWSDTIQHVRLTRRGVTQATASFGIGLQAPFGASAKLKVAFNSQVAVSTNVTIEAL